MLAWYPISMKINGTENLKNEDEKDYLIRVYLKNGSEQ